MDNFEKIIKVNENRIIRYSIINDYVPMHTIREDFLENGRIIKNYKLSQWDDYGFTGWINTENANKRNISLLSYDFDLNHPLYICLLHLLRGDDHLLIDDDATNELNKKYMIISKENGKITLTFINDLEDADVINKFYVFIKNIGSDCRSKIDCFYKDTKARLYLFFQETYERFNKEYHQITIEEYLLKNSKTFENDEIKKYVRKMNTDGNFNNY